MKTTLARGSVALVLAACAAQGSDNRAFGPAFEGAPDSGTPPIFDGSEPDAIDAAAPDGDAAGSDDASEGGSAIDASGCTATAAVVGGNASGLVTAVWSAGAFRAALSAGSLASVPAVVAAPSGYVAVARRSDDTLVSFTGTTTFSGPTPIAGATSRDAPALAVSGADVLAAYLEPTYKHAWARLSGGVWSAVGSPVGDVATQSFGPSAPAVADVGGSLELVHNGDGTADGSALMHRARGASWGDSAPIASTVTHFEDGPALAAIPAGTVDLVAVYVDKTTRYLTFVVRARATKLWGAPAVIAPVNLLPATDAQPQLVVLGATRVLLVWRGTDAKGYGALGTLSGGSVAWAPPSALATGSNPVLTAPPRAAIGICGDDAWVVLPTASGAMLTRLRGTSWSASEPVAGAAAMQLAAIATRP